MKCALCNRPLLKPAMWIGSNPIGPKCKDKVRQVEHEQGSKAKRDSLTRDLFEGVTNDDCTKHPKRRTKDKVMYFTKQGRYYVEAFPYAGCDESIVIMGAVRYALGRGSYSPGAVMDFCRAHWQEFEKNTRFVIMRDVMEWIGERHEWVKPGQFDSAWPDQWTKFLRWCFAQSAEEAQKAASANEWKRDGMQGVDEFFAVLPK